MLKIQLLLRNGENVHSLLELSILNHNIHPIRTIGCFGNGKSFSFHYYCYYSVKYR